MAETVLSVIERRIKSHRDYLIKNCEQCFTEQKHLDEGTVERHYYHYGYLSAAIDILRLLTKRRAN